MFIFFLSEDLTIIEINSKKAFSKPSSITLLLSKFISNGLDISMFLISKDFAYIFSVEKKNIFKDRVIKKYIRILNYFFFLIIMLHSNE